MRMILRRIRIYFSGQKKAPRRAQILFNAGYTVFFPFFDSNRDHQTPVAWVAAAAFSDRVGIVALIPVDLTSFRVQHRLDIVITDYAFFHFENP